MKIQGRSFSVIGMGRSGVAAANLLAKLGGDVLLSDRADSEGVRASAASLDPAVRTQFGREVVRAGDVAVLSPGIPPSAPAYRIAHRVADEVIGEMELFFRLFPGTVVAVTGTDGKSTTTTLIAHLLRTAGRNAVAAGNLGNPVCDLVPELGPDDVVVAEVSCFQLLTCSRFRPRVAVVTNLAEDHIEHHGSFDAYVRAKALVLARQAAGDAFVRNDDDPILRWWLRPGDPWTADNGQVVVDVSREHPVHDGAFFADGAFRLAAGGRVETLCDRAAFPLPGGHNVENALLAIAAARALGAAPDRLAEGLGTYRGLPHRIERVREVDGVVFYNDSKATNPHAAITGLRAFDEPVVLIAGGHEKDLSLDDLSTEVGVRCEAVVLVGECAGRMQREFPAAVPSEILPDLPSGVARALELARPRGRAVLFSPASSSYDQFRNFEERGDRFRELVNSL